MNVQCPLLNGRRFNLSTSASSDYVDSVPRPESPSMSARIRHALQRIVIHLEYDHFLHPHACCSIEVCEAATEQRSKNGLEYTILTVFCTSCHDGQHQHSHTTRPKHAVQLQQLEDHPDRRVPRDSIRRADTKGHRLTHTEVHH